MKGLQDTLAGPNYHPLPSDFVFNLHVDNTGDAVEDVTFQFVPGATFSGEFNAAKGIHEGLAIPVPISGGPNSRLVKVALAHIGPVTAADESALNYREHYQLNVFNGPLDSNRNIDNGQYATRTSDGERMLRKPFDYAGTKTFADYDAYANSFIHEVTLPGCAFPAKVFVGQRKDAFNINLGQVFDLVNLVPVEELVPILDPNGGPAQQDKFNTLDDKAVTELSIEVHQSCIRGASPNGVVGVWASVNYLNHVGPEQSHVVGAQKNRLGNPLVNELFVGLTDKDYWNHVYPKDDAIFREYLEYPTLPEIIEILFGNAVRSTLENTPSNFTSSLAPNVYPRTDILAILNLGIPGVNQQELVGTPSCETVTAPPLADLLRLNLDIPITPRAEQNEYGIIGSDNAGYPNGRRPGDDVVDIFLRVGMGRICHPPFDTLLGICSPAQAPVGMFGITDRAPLNSSYVGPAFPYLLAPRPGSQLKCE